MEAEFSTPWQHSKLDISSLIKFDPALRQQCGPGNLQRFLQTSVIQCFQRPPDGRGTRLWYFEVLPLHGPNPPELNREAEGGTRSPAGSGKDACEAGMAAGSTGRAQPCPGTGRTGSVAGEARDGRAGTDTGSSGRGEANPPGTRLRLHGEDSARSEGRAPQLPIARAKEGKASSPRSIPTLRPVSPCGCAQPGSAPRPGLVRRLLTARRRQLLGSRCSVASVPDAPAAYNQPLPGSSLRPRSAARCQGSGAGTTRSSPSWRDPVSRRPPRPVLTCARRA